MSEILAALDHAISVGILVLVVVAVVFLAAAGAGALLEWQRRTRR